MLSLAGMGSPSQKINSDVLFMSLWIEIVRNSELNSAAPFIASCSVSVEGIWFSRSGNETIPGFASRSYSDARGDRYKNVDD